MSGDGEATATRGSQAEELAWVMAMQAQSCAYLAEWLQIFAERLYREPLELPESIYNQLYDSHETMLALLDIMRQRLEGQSKLEHASYIPALNAHMAEEIRFMLVRGSAITMAECTTSIESRISKSTSDVGDTK